MGVDGAARLCSAQARLWASEACLHLRSGVAFVAAQLRSLPAADRSTEAWGRRSRLQSVLRVLRCDLIRAVTCYATQLLHAVALSVSTPGDERQSRDIAAEDKDLVEAASAAEEARLQLQLLCEVEIDAAVSPATNMSIHGTDSGTADVAADAAAAFAAAWRSRVLSVVAAAAAARGAVAEAQRTAEQLQLHFHTIKNGRMIKRLEVGEVNSSTNATAAVESPLAQALIGMKASSPSELMSPARARSPTFPPLHHKNYMCLFWICSGQLSEKIKIKLPKKHCECPVNVW